MVSQASAKPAAATNTTFEPRIGVTPFGGWKATGSMIGVAFDLPVHLHSYHNSPNRWLLPLLCPTATDSF